MSLPHEKEPWISPPRDGEDPKELALMLSGQPYLSPDPYIGRIRDAHGVRMQQINRIDDTGERMNAMREFIHMGTNVWIVQGFFCEYGFNITVADEVFIGANATFLDVCPITIGTRSMLGPNCGIYTPQHPVSPEERNGLKGREWAKPIVIGKDCWLGGSVIVCPGVTIGDGCTIGAGAVVTKNIPSRSVAIGNPARVVKHIEEDGTLVPV